MKTNYVKIVLMSIFLLAITAQFNLTNCFAGDGTIVNGKVNLIVMFNYDEPDPDSWRPVFEEFSKLLYNATEKQLQLGTINIANCSHVRERADIWVSTGNERASVNVVPGLGKQNVHITITQTHKSISGTALGQFGLTHEFGHYGFGLYDEYKGKIDGGQEWSQDNKLFFCVSANDPVCCIMDGGTMVPINNQRYEFCTNPAHNFRTSHQEAYEDDLGRRIETAQEFLNHESCWETMARTVGLKEPASEPQNDISGHQPITWNLIESIDRLVTCIDRSGSMTGEKINLARQGAIIFVDLVYLGEYLAVTSFASSASVNYAMTEISSDADKTNARSAINTITAGGSTNIGGGLRVSLNQITGNGINALGCAEVIVLLSDGMHNTGEHPNSVIPDLKKRGVRVYTIGLGADVDDSILSNIAHATGGTYSFAANATDLANIFARISAETRADDAYTTFEQQIAAGQEKEHLTPVDVFTEEITFELNWPGANNLNLTLISPSGKIINPTIAAADPKIEFVDGSIHEFYRIQNPEVGNWKSKVTGASVSGSIKYNLLAFGQSSSVSVYANVDKSTYAYPEDMKIEASVVAGLPVTGVDITGIVNRPDGSTSTIQLYDDGKSVNGDKFAHDGIYSARFANYAGNNGSFNFKLKINNISGVTISPDLLPFSEQGGNYQSKPVSPFVREAHFSAVITGVPKVLNMESFKIEYAKIVFTNFRKDIFRGYGNFVLNENSPGINPAIEDVKFKMGIYEQRIPAGSFVKVEKFRGFVTGVKDTTIWLYQNNTTPNASGITEMVIATVDGRSGVIGFDAKNVNLSEFRLKTNPDSVKFSLFIGNNFGENIIKMRILGLNTWIYGDYPPRPMKMFKTDYTDEDESPMPQGYNLFQNYPNPFNASTTITFNIPQRVFVELTISDIRGIMIARLINGSQEAGEHRITFDASGLPSGVYFCHLKAGNFSQTQKMILIK